jgi:hypothetical protein
MSAATKILKWTERRSNTLQGFFDFTFGSLIIHDASLHRQNDKYWIGLPGKPQIDRDDKVRRDARGKVQYTPVVTTTDKAATDKLSTVVLEALRAARPELFE